jgi:hypothetical protein
MLPSNHATFFNKNNKTSNTTQYIVPHPKIFLHANDHPPQYNNTPWLNSECQIMSSMHANNDCLTFPSFRASSPQPSSERVNEAYARLFNGHALYWKAACWESQKLNEMSQRASETQEWMQLMMNLSEWNRLKLDQEIGELNDHEQKFYDLYQNISWKLTHFSHHPGLIRVTNHQQAMFQINSYRDLSIYHPNITSGTTIDDINCLGNDDFVFFSIFPEGGYGKTCSRFGNFGYQTTFDDKRFPYAHIYLQDIVPQELGPEYRELFNKEKLISYFPKIEQDYFNGNPSLWDKDRASILSFWDTISPQEALEKRFELLTSTKDYYHIVAMFMIKMNRLLSPQLQKHVLNTSYDHAQNTMLFFLRPQLLQPAFYASQQVSFL